MARRFFSVLFFVFGGWMLGGQMLMAFVDLEPGAFDNIVMLGFAGLFALLLLLIGVWISPGERWRELGLTILIAAPFTLFSGLGVAFSLLDPMMKDIMPAIPDIRLAPVWGGLNLLVVTGVGLWLYLDGGRSKAAR